METSKLKKFAQHARRNLIEQVSNKLKLVLAEDSAARRENPKAVAEIEKRIFGVSGQYTDNCTLTTDDSRRQAQLVERVAYIWFNRFCALRFMDVNRYTRIGVVSPAEGQFQPEILAEAKMGHIDEGMVDESARQRIFALIDGKTPSQDPQAEAYRLLVVAICNYWHGSMPFMFERIADFTELLMPDDLLSGNSILSLTREAMTPETCGAGSNQLSVISNQKRQTNELTDGCGLKADSLAAAGGVEMIGWLYQFYISEKKDEVFEGLKKNKKITPENIPAATQLFTPHWIVRYLVENSLGRLWMLNRPDSKLIELMDYYIRPEQPESDFLHISSPEEIKICDPACGSGHMLTYAFDLLYAIYEEEGYEPAEIPEKILTQNLYGIEIDERAGELAAFALTMKARAKQRRFFRKQVLPNICVLENIQFDEDELAQVVSNQLSAVSKETKSAFLHDMKAFEEADNFGSLIRPAMTPAQISEVKKVVTDYCKLTTDIFERAVLEKVQQALRQADYLSPKYHVVIANPPYMGGKGMNGRLGKWAKDNCPNSKSDLFAMFIERNLDLAQRQGAVAMITMQSWMFLSSFEKLRSRLLAQDTILSMAHLGAKAFDSIGGEVVSTTAFVLENQNKPEYKGGYLRLIDGNAEAEKEAAILEAIKNPDCGWFYRASAADFNKIPGSPIAYWVSDRLRSAFVKHEQFSSVFFSDGLTKTGDNDKYLRFHWEVTRIYAENPDRYRICVKGGDARDYYGNTNILVNWEPQVREHYRSDNVARITPDYLWQSAGISWTKISSKGPTFRWFGNGMIAETGGPAIFVKESASDSLLFQGLGFLTSKVSWNILTSLNPTLNFQTNDVLSLPFNVSKTQESSAIVENLLAKHKMDWDAYETSWDFTNLPLLNPDYRQPTLKATYQKLRAHLQEMTLEMQRLEEENNRIFIDAYGLQDELTPEVPLGEVTLTCNPHYRYNGDKSEDELEALLLADTMKEFISYAVGCMFGRYSLDAPGLILANQGETTEDYFRVVQEKRERPDSLQPSVISNQQKEQNALTDDCKLTAEGSSPGFQPDEDNVIPMLDGNWFTDDITERFFKFLRVTFGEEHYEENLEFIEQAIGKNIRKYFLKDFYADHVKRYKKRPIYWLFSSPKGSFNALIYMHRYRPDTVSVVLNDYLREFRAKLASRKNHLEAVSISASASKGEKTRALKEIEKLKKIILELEDYERDVLYPLATQQVEIDLDDGVKVNYKKFGKALKKVVGLSAK
ncbi:BREX-1 system adenine-specific DNA-methyltransferase PglX [Thiolapillus sp.]|uniref:BREX-1 system adenine-specific DNA-methyltransferase PglX n=1 Tax=Thiolapillus sp. TaxID=2017437 RepID=UPI0025FECC40|nr:BREX-1 system adenine-specific DNA-methyltransferase PglX [Thiolapillus sp.]